MNYRLTKISELEEKQCIVFGVFSETEPTNDLKILTQHQPELLDRLIKKMEKKGDLVWQTDFQSSSPLSLLLIHCGKSAEFTTNTLNSLIDQVANQLLKQHLSSATICFPQVSGATPNRQLEQMAIRLNWSLYQLLDFKTDKKHQHTLHSLSFILDEADETALTTATAITHGITLTRTLANLPANICTPSYLAAEAIKLAEKYPTIETSILHQEDLKTLGMGALLAVAQGSHEPPKLIEIHYQGDASIKPIVLVGKGITFDSGGISLKPAHGMEEMKYDMAGAASVLGTIKACAELQLPIHVIGLMACAENMPGGGAVKPGDIITTLSGKTVEIINTDAEGRLVLADALTYAEKFHPEFVIDIATLTGAIIVALGHEHTGLMTENEALAKRILDASFKSKDKVWRMPLEEAYQEALDSQLADMVNSTFDRSAGSVTAACFLSRFTQKYPWAHLDIAGTGWISGRKNQATGRPVSLLIEILRHVAD